MNFLTTAALLDSIVLAVLSRGDMYGYTLTKEITQTLDVAESSIYPALRRLLKGDFLVAYDEPENGRNRRYYQLTPQGEAKLAEFQGQWEEAKQNLNKILGGAV